jgi:hypothetical protein
MRVAEIWRFPVKSMQGERLDVAEVTDLGITGDRQWAIRDVESGHVLTARRTPALLFAVPEVVGDEVRIHLPDGSVTSEDAVLSEWLGAEVQLVRPSSDDRPIYSTPTEVEYEDARPWATWQGPAGAFHDSTRSRITLVSTATLGAWDRRRFRINVIVDSDGENELVGQHVGIGADVVIDIKKRVDRCVMVTRPQPDGIERDLGVLKAIIRDRESSLGIGGLVTSPGTIRVGDEVTPLSGAGRTIG